MRANADYCVTFGQEDPLQVEAICEHYMCKIPKNNAIALLNKYAYKDPYSEKNYALVIDVTDIRRAKCYEQRLYQACFKQTPPFLLGTEEYWGDELEEKLQYMRDVYLRSEKAGPDSYWGQT